MARYRKLFAGTAPHQPEKPDQRARIVERMGEHFPRLGVDSDADIARAVGLTGERIRQFRVVLGIEAPPMRPRSLLAKLVAAGTLPSTIEEAAEAAGITVNSARVGLRNLGVKPLPSGRVRVLPELASERAIRPLLASHGNKEIAAITGYSTARVGQIRAEAFIPAPRVGHGNRLTMQDELIERATCALGRDIGELTGNIRALSRKHGVSVSTLTKWRNALRACGYFKKGGSK